MGAGSSDASAYTYIETDVSSFVPGATVTGNVKILSEKPIQAGQMTILLSCISEVRWVVRTRSRRARSTRGVSAYNTHHYHDKRTLFTVQFPIWNFQGQLPQGQFTLPFSIQLPTNLPPSFECSGVHRGSGKNEYTFEAVVEGSPDVQAQKTIVWVSRLPGPNKALVPASSEASLRVASCCCFKSGRVNLKSEANRRAAMVTDELVVTSKIDNSNNKHTVNKITCTLVRLVRFKIVPRIDGGSFGPAVAATIIMEEDVSGSQDLDIKPGKSDPLEVAMSLNLTFNPNLWMKPTINSETIECEYFMRVDLSSDNFCGCGTKFVSFPIEICNGMVVNNTVFSPPPQINVAWNPSMLASAPVSAQGISNLTQDMTMVDHNTTRGDMESGNKIVPK